MQPQEKQFSSSVIASNMIAQSVRVFGLNIDAAHGEVLTEDAQSNERAMTATRLALEVAAVAPIVPLAVLADTYAEPELSSGDIAQHVISVVMDFFLLTREQAAARLAMIDFKAYAQVEGV